MRLVLCRPLRGPRDKYLLSLNGGETNGTNFKTQGECLLLSTIVLTFLGRASLRMRLVQRRPFCGPRDKYPAFSDGGEANGANLKLQGHIRENLKVRVVHQSTSLRSTENRSVRPHCYWMGCVSQVRHREHLWNSRYVRLPVISSTL